MALHHLAPMFLASAPPNALLEDCKYLHNGIAGSVHPVGGIGGVRFFLSVGLRWRRRFVICHQAAESQMVENAQMRGSNSSSVEIPVSCYQIVGIPDQAEKDKVVKSVLELRRTEIEEGYTLDVVVSREELLLDMRDKLLFEMEYAGNAKEKIPPKSSLRIPWAWLPAALCLLQEVGEENLVLEIAREALGHQDAKPYIHDLLLSMALAECSIAKIGFEKNKVSQGFEALARAQYLLRSKESLEKMPLLAQIEESLEELAPACTLELLNMPCTPDKSERRRGAIAALRELLRQGLEVETSCRVQDWPCFLIQALNKLTAAEIVDLLPWDELALSRSNKKSIESQNQRVVIDFSCFYMSMTAHIALGFSSRQTDLINKAKTICACLMASEGIDLKYEDALCSFLLGQGGQAAAAEKLQKPDAYVPPSSQGVKLTASNKGVKDSTSANQSLETWLKDVALDVFPDTRGCSPSLANFFRGDKKVPRSSKQKIEIAQVNVGVSRRSPSFVLPPNHRTSGEPLLHMNSTQHLGSAVKQLTPANLQSQLAVGKSSSNTASPSVQLKRSLGMHQNKVWENWQLTSDMVGRMSIASIMGCLFFTAFKLLQMQLGQMRSQSKWYSTGPKRNSSALGWTVDGCADKKSDLAHMDENDFMKRLCKLLGMFRTQFKYPAGEGNAKSSWPVDDLTSLIKASAGGSNMFCKREMPIEEAEALVEQWQAIKAEALGPNYQLHNLSEILSESMLAQWTALAESAKARSCYWRFVLLQSSILHAEILSNGVDLEIAEIEAILEEAAELVDESQPKNPNYYSTYKIHYVLKRHYDGSWRFCGSGIQTPV